MNVLIRGYGHVHHDESSFFMIIISGLFVSVFLSLLIVKSHSMVTFFSFDYWFQCKLVPFLGAWYLIVSIHSVQCIYFATRSCCWRYSLFIIVGHSDIMWLIVTSLCVHSPYLGSAPFLMIFAWYARVARIWFCAANMKPSSVLPFRLELLSQWCIVVLSTSLLSVPRGYLPCSSFSVHFFLIII